MAEMTQQPENLIDRVMWNLAIFPLASDADRETVRAHRALRERFNMNPDLSQRGDS